MRISIGLATAAALTAALMAATPAAADILIYERELTGQEQVPPVATSGHGELVAVFDTDTRTLSWSVTYAGLSGVPTAVHFHGPADLGVNAAVALLVPGEFTSPFIGTAVLTRQQAAELLADLWYLNIHTAANPGGEIRAHLIDPRR